MEDLKTLKSFGEILISNIPLSGVGNFNGTASMVSMVSGPGKNTGHSIIGPGSPFN